MSASALDNFLSSCESAEKALSANAGDVEGILARCAAELSNGASWTEGELEAAGKALMKLRITAESKSRFNRIRAHMAQTLVKASAPSAGIAQPKGVDRVF
jgi:hypothetical protein